MSEAQLWKFVLLPIGVVVLVALFGGAILFVLLAFVLFVGRGL